MVSIEVYDSRFIDNQQGEPISRGGGGANILFAHFSRKNMQINTFSGGG